MGLHCLSWPFCRATSVKDFRTFVVMHIAIWAISQDFGTYKLCIKPFVIYETDIKPVLSGHSKIDKTNGKW